MSLEFNNCVSFDFDLILVNRFTNLFKFFYKNYFNKSFFVKLITIEEIWFLTVNNALALRSLGLFFCFFVL